ncbi:hypothetical protein E3U55_12485 [Filobacillus milosensis]|uniref:Uncharacterized protein n=1 Tax=Filobacillus milosensis TaxID=94137 RepID=A0A4Y8IHM7_9BACI|nr:hypothetical protein [Filobacillus milosensis]TFB15063.1 hypothetical protein E3U55_12485 [Filobacillus milosensis]
MPLEEEVRGLLIGGFSTVMGICMLICVFLLIKKNNNLGYTWIFLHLLLVSVAANFALRVITFDSNHPMASEEISLQISISGIIWTFSMIFLVFGLISFSKEKV